MKCCSYKFTGRKTYSRKPIGIFQFSPGSTVPTVVRFKSLSLESEEYVLWDFNLYLHNYMQNIMKNTYFKGKTSIASSCMVSSVIIPLPVILMELNMHVID